jgi:hypothetical protein
MLGKAAAQAGIIVRVKDPQKIRASPDWMFCASQALPFRPGKHADVKYAAAMTTVLQMTTSLDFLVVSATHVRYMSFDGFSSRSC